MKRCRARGFTLVEFLIALTLLGLLSSVMFSALYLASNSSERLDRRMEAQLRLQNLEAVLVRLLGQARAVEYQDQGRRRPVFSGDQQRLELVTPLSGFVGQGGLHLLRLQTAQEDDGLTLFLSRWFWHPEVLEDGAYPNWGGVGQFSTLRLMDRDEAPSLDPKFGVRRLAEGLEDIRFRYLQQADGADPQWHDSWTDQGQLPRMLEVTLQLDGLWWPPILIRLVDYY